MQINHKYEFQRKQGVIRSSFPVMKGFTPLKIRNERVFAEMALQRKKQQQDATDKQIKFLERMKKTREVILSHHRKNRYSQSHSISRKIKTQENALHSPRMKIHASNRQSLGYYRIGEPVEHSQNGLKNLLKEKQEHLRACQSDFNPNKYQNKAYLFNKIPARQLGLEKDYSGKSKGFSAPINLNPQKLDQIKSNSEIPEQCRKTQTSREQRPSINVDYLNYNSEGKALVLPYIRNIDQKLMSSIKIQKNIKLYQRDEAKFSQNKKASFREVQKQQKMQENLKEIKETEESLRPEKKKSSKRTKRSINNSENLIKNIFRKQEEKTHKKMQDLDFEVQGWKSDQNGSIYLE